MDSAMQQLIDAVKQAAPVMWAAAYRQVYVDAYEGIFGIVVTVSLAVFGIGWLRNRWEELDDIVCVVAPILISLLLILAFVWVIGTTDCLANPTFQAIKYLVSFAHPGS